MRASCPSSADSRTEGPSRHANWPSDSRSDWAWIGSPDIRPTSSPTSSVACAEHSTRAATPPAYDPCPPTPPSAAGSPYRLDFVIIIPPDHSLRASTNRVNSTTTTALLGNLQHRPLTRESTRAVVRSRMFPYNVKHAARLFEGVAGRCGLCGAMSYRFALGPMTIGPHHWQIVGLVLDLVGVLLLGADLIRLHRSLRTRAATTRDFYDQLEEAHGRDRIWMREVAEKYWKEPSRSRGDPPGLHNLGNTIESSGEGNRRGRLLRCLAPRPRQRSAQCHRQTGRGTISTSHVG